MGSESSPKIYSCLFMWDEVKHGGHNLRIRELDLTAINSRIAEFWKFFAADLLPQVDPDLWDHLSIDVRGIDGGIGVYPQDSKRPPFRVPWAHLDIHKLGYDFQAMSEADLESSKVEETNKNYAHLLIEGARRVDLAKLANRSEGVLLCFVSYAEEKLSPFLEERIMPA